MAIFCEYQCLEGLEKAAVRVGPGNKRLACPTCQAGCEKNSFIKLTLSAQSCISSRPQLKIAQELESIKNRLLNPALACTLAFVEEEAERLKAVPKLITSHNLSGHLPNYLSNFATEARLVKGVNIRNNTRIAITRLERLIEQLYMQQGVAVCLCEGIICQCAGSSL